MTTVALLDTPVLQEDTMTGTIRNRISEILGRKRMSIRDFELKAGLSYNTAWKLYHATTTQITFEVMAKVCEALDAQVGEVFEYVPEENGKDAPYGDAQ